MLSFEDALQIVRDKVCEAKVAPAKEILPLDHVWGRVLAEDVRADRDYPPFHRSTRDGYAVRSGDVRALPAGLQVRGEIRAGESFPGKVGPGECVRIMTGAPLPAGTDAVVMLEQVRTRDSLVEVMREIARWDNVVPRGSEAAAGRVVLTGGKRLGAGEMGVLATVGLTHVPVFRRPTVAVLSTGDELVELDGKTVPELVADHRLQVSYSTDGSFYQRMCEMLAFGPSGSEVKLVVRRRGGNGDAPKMGTVPSQGPVRLPGTVPCFSRSGGTPEVRGLG